jgi:hypothetical protein
MFINGVGANPFTPLPEVVSGVVGAPTVVPPTPYGSGPASGGTPLPQIWAQSIRIVAAGALELSFDGTNVHGKVDTTTVIYRNRFESGIAVRGAGAFTIEAW